MTNQKLVEENLDLVKKVSYKTKLPELTTFTYDDFMQAGYEGLCTAAEKYDKTKNPNFSTYAYNFIRWEILNQYRKQFLIPTSEIKKGNKKANFTDVDNYNENTIHPLQLTFEEKLEILDDIIRTLSPRQKEIVFKRFYLDMEISEIAQELGLYKSGIKLTLKNALNKMRKAIA
jgi:RNA polymerase sigma factor (sigma-70 family)